CWTKGKCRLLVFNRTAETPFRLELEHLPTRPFVVSRDGRYVAREVANGRVQVCATDSGAPTFTFPVGRHHDAVAIELGETHLILRAGGRDHVLDWSGDELRVSYVRPGPSPLKPSSAYAAGVLRGDHQRWRHVVTHGG